MEIVGGRYKRITGKDGKEYLIKIDKKDFMLKGYCGNCGERITEDYIDSGRVVCPKCHWDSWESELLPIGYKKQGYMTLKDMRASVYLV